MPHRSVLHRSQTAIVAIIALAVLTACAVERASDERIDTSSALASGGAGQTRVDTLVRTVIDTVVDTLVDTVVRPSGDAVVPQAAAAPPVVGASDLAALTARRLTVPVKGVPASSITGSFDAARGATRRHEALDILAPRGTPVLAADDGRLLKLFSSKLGGLTIYQADPTGRFIYYYAHMDGYRAGLQEGATLVKGEVIGYVGTTGNAPLKTPHLHFAVSRTDGTGRWWTGTPMDPAQALRGG